MEFFLNLFVLMIIANIIYLIYAAFMIIKHNPSLHYSNEEEFDYIFERAAKPFIPGINFLKHCLKASLMGLILSLILFQ